MLGANNLALMQRCLFRSSSLLQKCSTTSKGNVGLCGKFANQQRSYSSFPPHTILNMPALSPTMSQGNLVKWHINVGDELKPGMVLADLETDKATLAFENQDEGYVAKLLVEDGAKDVLVGNPLAVIVEDEESIPLFASFSPSSSPVEASKPAPVEASPAAASQSSYPPHTPLNMPALSPTMERGNIVSWKVKEGDEIRAGDVLADLETDKAVLAFENQEDGFIARLLVPEGTKDVPIGSLLAIVVEDRQDVAAFANYTLSAAAAPASAPAAAAHTLDPSPAASPCPPTKPAVKANVRMGPAARLLLKAAGLTPEDITHPTGPRNIITKGDVLAKLEAIASGANKAGAPKASSVTPASKAPAAVVTSSAAPPKPKPTSTPVPVPVPSGGAYTDVPNSQIRKVIASRLIASKREIPALYASLDADLGALHETRALMAKQGVKLSINDFVLKAVAEALAEVPEANVFWDEQRGEPVQFPSIDVCVAVSTARGLITPIVRGAGSKSLAQINREVRELAGRARENKLKPDEFQGGSFTVSNLGMYGLSHFSAIINPPQSCILAVGGAMQKVVLGSDGLPRTRDYLTLTISADHRVFDGDLTARLLQAIGNRITSPLSLLV